MGQPRQSGRPLKRQVSENFLICAITYLMNINTTIPQPMPGDNRLYVDVITEGMKGVKALVDTGAAISVLALEVFYKIPRRDKLKTVPVNPSLRLSSASGGKIEIVGRYMLNLEFPKQDDRTVCRPIYIVTGLAHHAMILGMDFIREQQMIISADHVFFQSIPQEHELSAITLGPAADIVLPPRTLVKLTVAPKTAHGKRLPTGTQVVAYTAKSNIGVYDSLNEVNTAGHITCVVANKTNNPILLGENETIGFADVVDSEDCLELNDQVIAEIFGSFGEEPKEPERGPAPFEPKDRDFLEANVRIEATAEWRQRYLDLILRYHDTCSKGSFDLGRTKTVKHAIRLKDQEPIHIKQFRIPLEHVDVIHDWVEELEAKGAVRISRSPYNNPIFLVKKGKGPNVGLRVVLDYRKLNAASVPDKYTIREVRDCIDEIGRSNSKVFSAIDLTSGFWQQELEESSRQYTAFTVPGKGTRYEWTVTPMGLQGSPSSFARLIDYVMRKLKGVICYIDDVLVHSESNEQQLERLEEVFLRLRKYGLKLNVKKSVFGANSVDYLGYKLSGEGVSPGPDKLKAVREYPMPDSIKKIREFIGICNYFRFLVPEFQKHASQLTKLLKKDSTYESGALPKESQEAFLYLRRTLSEEPIVSHPKRGLPFQLRTDACAGDDLHPGGFGAVLSQTQNGHERVIAYASRALTSYEKNYQPYLLELAAAAWAIDHFHVYLKGRQFKLYTDHKPLEAMSKLHKKTMNRLQQQLLEYDFTVNYIKGTDNTVADALSRNVASLEHKRMLPLNLKEGKNAEKLVKSLTDSSGSLLQAQRTDPFIKDVYAHIAGEHVSAPTPAYAQKVERFAKDSILKDGIVFYRTHTKNRPSRLTVLAPQVLRDKIMREAHTTWDGGHGGEQRTLDRIALNFSWPGMSVDVDNFIKRCLRCQEAKGRKPAPSPLKNLPLCEEPNERIHADLFGPLKSRSAEGNCYILVITDAFSKYAELVALPDKKAETVAKAIFERWVCRFSVPRMIVTDNGKEFANEMLEDLCKFMGIKQNKTTPYHPQSNSSAESYNRQIRKYLTAMLENSETLDWEEWLPMLMFSYNTHVHSATKESPFFLTFLHDPRLPYFDIDKPRTMYGEDYVTHTYQMMKESFREARNHLEEQASRAKHYHDLKAKARQFKIGQRVMVFFPDAPKGVNQKFFKRWRGPYLVKNLVGKLNLELQDMEKPRAKTVIIHYDRCKVIKSDQELVGEEVKPETLKDKIPSWADDVEVQEMMDQQRDQVRDQSMDVSWEIPGTIVIPEESADQENNLEAGPEEPAENQGQAAGPERPNEQPAPAPPTGQEERPTRLTRAQAARANAQVPSLYPIRF